MPTTKVSGKAGSISIDGVLIAFKKWSANIERTNQDSTDSVDYDGASDLVHKSQIPVTIQSTVDVEGNYSLTNTATALVAKMYSGIDNVPVILKVNATVVFGHGNFDLSNFKADEPVDDIVTFTCTLMSDGVFTPGA